MQKPKAIAVNFANLHRFLKNSRSSVTLCPQGKSAAKNKKLDRLYFKVAI